MSAAACESVAAPIVRCFNAMFATEPPDSGARAERYEWLSHLLLGYHTAGRLTPAAWEELYSRIDRIDWLHQVAQLTLRIAATAQGVFPGQAAFQPITVRLPGDTEEILSARALKQLLGWPDDDALGTTRNNLDLSKLPRQQAAVLLAFIRSKTFGRCTLNDMHALLTCAGQWRSRPLERALLETWLLRLLASPDSDNADTICAGLVALQMGTPPLQYSIQELWALTEALLHTIKGSRKIILFQKLTEAIARQAHADALPADSGLRPIRLFGLEGAHCVVSAYAIMLAEKGTDLSDLLPVATYTLLRNNLHGGKMACQ